MLDKIHHDPGAQAQRRGEEGIAVLDLEVSHPRDPPHGEVHADD